MKILKLKKALKNYWFYLASPFIVTIITRDLFFTAGIISYGDFAVFPIDGLQSIMVKLSVWKPVNLGVIEGTVYSHIITSLLSLVAGNAKIGQNLFILFLLTFTLWSFYAMMHHLTKSVVASAVSSIIYMVNPAFFNQFVIGPFLLVGYAIAPIILLSIIKYFDTKRNIYAIIFLMSLSFAAFFGTYISIYLFGLILPYVSLVFLLSLCHRYPKIKARSFVPILVAPIVVFLANLPAVAQILFQYLKISSTEYTFLPEIVERRATYVYSGISFLNLFRLLGGPLETANRYLTAISMNGVVGLFLLVFGSISFIFRSCDTVERVKGAIGFTLISTIGVIWLIKLKAINIYFLPFFRDTVLFMFILAFCYSILVGFTLTGIEHNIKSRRLRRVILTLACLFMLISTTIYNAGALDGSLGWFKQYNRSDVTIPEYYVDVLKWLIAQHRMLGFFRTLWFPWDYRTFTYVSPTDPFIFGAWPGSEQWNYPNIDLINSVFKLISNKSTSHLGSLLSPFSVKYIVVLKARPSYEGIHTVNLFQKTLGITGSPSEFINFLNKQKDLHLIYKSEDFYVYENLMFVPFITKYNSSILLMNTSIVSLNNLELVFNLPGFDIKKYVIFFSEDIASQKLNESSISVDHIIYFNTKMINFVNVNASQTFIFNRCPLHPIKVKIPNDITLGIAVLANSAPLITINKYKIAEWHSIMYNNTHSWYIRTFKIELNNQTTITLNNCLNINEVVIFRSDETSLFSSTFDNKLESANAPSWTVVSSTYDKSWLVQRSLLHVKAFGFSNAFYGSNLGIPYNSLQLPFNILIIVSVITWLALIILLGITFKKKLGARY